MRQLSQLRERIEFLIPGAIFSEMGEDYDRIEWLDNRPLPSYEDVVAVGDEINKPKPFEVDEERDRRVAGGVTFLGKVFQSNAESRGLIEDAGDEAESALLQGAVDGDYRWYSPDEDFAWLAIDKSWLPLDAVQTVAFAKRVKRHRGACYRAAIALKVGPIPEDFRDDKYWPE